MTDELDLVGALGSAEPLRPEAYQRARAVLRAAMADPEPCGCWARYQRRTRLWRRLQPWKRRQPRGATNPAQRFSAAAGSVSRADWASPPEWGCHRGGSCRCGAQLAGDRGTEVGQDSSAATSGSATVDGSAERAADDPGRVHQNGLPSTGDAWLVKATQVHGTKTMQVVYTLYTDGHAIYTGNSVKDIKRAIARHQDQMTDGGYAPLLKAAVAAADSSRPTAGPRCSRQPRIRWWASTPQRRRRCGTSSRRPPR
ncbi:hypothetical protein NKG94_16620 [Micromonospora sp. M12]